MLVLFLRYTAFNVVDSLVYTMVQSGRITRFPVVFWEMRRYIVGFKPALERGLSLVHDDTVSL